MGVEPILAGTGGPIVARMVDHSGIEPDYSPQTHPKLVALWGIEPIFHLSNLTPRPAQTLEQY
jgi:hypothetical protein